MHAQVGIYHLTHVYTVGPSFSITRLSGTGPEPERAQQDVKLIEYHTMLDWRRFKVPLESKYGNYNYNVAD